MRWVFLLLTLASLGVQAQPYRPGSFGALIASVPTLELPLDITGEPLHSPGMSPVGSEWSGYLPDASLDYGRRYVVGSLDLYDSVEILLYEMESPAGGYSSTYYLLTYDPAGSLIDHAKIAEVSGSLEHDTQSAVAIDAGGHVSGTIVTTRYGEDETIMSEATETISLMISPSGAIRHD